MKVLSRALARRLEVHMSSSLLASAFLTLALFGPPREWNPVPAPRDSSVLTIAGKDEPGRRMIVTGRVFSRDGKKVRAGTRVGVYQTDARGEYRNIRGRARLSGWLVTDSLGRYELRTIRPGAYPQGGTPEHIHFIVDGWGTYELRFATDPRVTAADREASRAEGTFGTVQPVTTDARGVQHVVRDLRSRY
jgi:protocatechuate 3,4-dioxygenase beta subunit